MTTYQPPPGAMMQHPGMAPGQPMGPGMGPSPTGPMGQPPAQGMPPGIPPGMTGPPPNQAMMAAGMHPAQAGPNAHAMSQLQPGGHMFPQNRQMQQFAQNNPNMMMPQNNQAMLRQQQAMLQAQQLQQGMAPGAPGIPPGMQQFQQMNGGMRANFPSSMAAQAQAQAAQQQAQAQAQAQRGGMPHMGMQNPQAGTPGQPGHPAQAIQMRQQPMPGGEPQSANMQQGPTPTSQAPPPGTPHPPQNQPNPSQQPTRPPSAASLPNQSGPPQQPGQQQQPQQPRPQGPQGQQPNQGQQPGQPSGPQPNQQGGPAQGAQQQGPTMEQQQQAQQQRMMQMRQQQQQQAMQQNQQAQQAGGNPMLQRPGFQGGAQLTGTLRLFLFADELSTGPPIQFNNPNVTPAHRLQYLKTIVMKNFSENAVFHRVLYNAREKAVVRGAEGARKFEISAPLLGRYFMSHFDGGLERFQIILGNAREHTLPALPPMLTGQYIDCQRSMIVEWYPKGTQIVHNGALKAIVNSSNGKIDWMEFVPTSVEAFISRGGLTSLFPTIGEPPAALESPKMNKKTEKQQQQQHQQKMQDYERRKNERQIQFGNIPPLLVREDLFITDGVKRFYETAEIVSGMKDFVEFASKHPSMKPVEARDKYLEAVDENNKMLQAQWANQQMMQASNSGISTPATMNGPQNPNMQGQFASPHNMGGSPHIGASPSQPQHMGHPMAANPSQQGTNSTAASANASPNMAANKRRRSTVKNEGSEDGPSEVNGGNQAKVKQSPKPKRQKSTAG